MRYFSPSCSTLRSDPADESSILPMLKRLGRFRASNVRRRRSLQIGSMLTSATRDSRFPLLRQVQLNSRLDRTTHPPAPSRDTHPTPHPFPRLAKPVSRHEIAY